MPSIGGHAFSSEVEKENAMSAAPAEIYAGNGDSEGSTGRRCLELS
jgi:hypothetical protein